MHLVLGDGSQFWEARGQMLRFDAAIISYTLVGFFCDCFPRLWQAGLELRDLPTSSKH